MRPAGTSVAACLLAILAVGCGSTHKPPAGSSSDQAEISTAIHSYLHAQAQGDGTAACALLTPAAQKQLIDLVLSAGKGLIPTAPSCTDAVALVRAVAGAPLLSALDSARVGRIQVNGSGASAQVSDGTAFQPQTVRLEKTGGSWKIAGVPNLRL